MKGLIFMLLLLLFCNGSRASVFDSVQHIDEVVLNMRIVKDFVPVQKINANQIQNISSSSVADVLRNFSGLQIKDYGGIGGLKTVNIRSMGTNHTGIFYDGVQVSNALNGQTDLSKFSTDNIDEIALYNGQRSSIFQSAKDFASSGSIYITVKEPVFCEGKNTNIKASFRTASYKLLNNRISYGLTNPSVLWQQKIGDKLSISSNVEFVQANGLYKARYKRVNPADNSLAYDTSFVRNNSDIKSLRMETGLFGKIENGEWRTKLYLFTSDRGLPGAVVQNNFVDEGARLSDLNLFAQGSFRKYFGFYETQLTGKLSHDYMRFTDYDIVRTADGEYNTNISTDKKYIQNEYYIASANKFSVLPFLDVAFSADFIVNKLNAEFLPVRYNELIALAAEFKLSKLAIQANVTGSFVQDKTNTYFESGNRALTPAVLISYKPANNEDFTVNAFYKQGFRMPTFSELHYTELYLLNVSSHLKPEYTEQYDLGVRYSKSTSLFQQLNFSADIYYNNVKDKITAYPSGSLFRWTMQNIGKVSILGSDINISAQTKLAENFVLDTRVAYTYQRAQDITDKTDAFYSGQIPYIPKHSGSFGVSAILRSWVFNYNFIYTGERYSSSANLVEYKLQPWYTSDISVIKKFKIGSKAIKISGEVNNLFDQYYDVVKNYPMPGQYYKLGISVEY